LREANDQILAAGGQVVAIAPDSIAAMQKHLKTNDYPFTVVADTDGKIFDAYDVTSRLIALGQQPAMFIVDTQGVVRFDAVGKSQWDLISPKQIQEELASIH
jgi:peroxiredoxin